MIAGPTAFSMPPFAAPVSSASRTSASCSTRRRHSLGKFRPAGQAAAIITNGGGPGAMAADRAGDLDIPLAQLNMDTVQKLNARLPPTWSHANPIDIVGDATPERYRDAILAVPRPR